DVYPLWYVYWLLGLLAALLTAFYTTRLMLYTFHGPNRTGERESAHLHEAPWVMTGPLVVLGALSVAGGALNVPALFGGRAPPGSPGRSAGSAAACRPANWGSTSCCSWAACWPCSGPRCARPCTRAGC